MHDSGIYASLAFASPLRLSASAELIGVLLALRWSQTHVGTIPGHLREVAACRADVIAQRESPGGVGDSASPPPFNVNIRVGTNNSYSGRMPVMQGEGRMGQHGLAETNVI